MDFEKKFKDACGYELCLNNPRYFSEKIQWIKVKCHEPLMTQCADKYLVRDYVKNKVGTSFLTKIYGVYNNAEAIEVNKLPKQFVIKTNHASGQVIICKDKKQLDWKKVKKQLNCWLNENYYYVTGEWVYKNIKPRIIIEELLDDNIVDYKFYCFNGKPKFLYVSEGLGGDHNLAKMNFLYLNWQKTEFQRVDYKQFDSIPERPVNLNEMIRVCEKIACDFHFVRVDLYSIKRTIIFSELTFYPNGGFAPFYPIEWEKKIGSWIKLPIDN